VLHHPHGRDPAPRYGTGTVLVTAGPGPVVTLRDTAGAELDVLRLGEDLGRAAAVNRAVAALPPDVGRVVLADPGTAFRPGALDALTAAADRHPRAGLLAPRVAGERPPPDRAEPPEPDPAAPLAAGRPLAGLLAARLVGVRPRRRGSRGAAERFPTDGALLRRAALDSVDGFRPVADPDADLCERLVRAGWLVLAVPSAEVALGPA
jgi:N-acetylglucosaminyl-diphospho-decaprenol L-rhamnosyltransferase